MIPRTVGLLEAPANTWPCGHDHDAGQLVVVAGCIALSRPIFPRFWALAVLVLASVPVVLLPIGPAWGAAASTYDPASCKTDAKGKLYIALGRDVLAVPHRGTTVVGQIAPAERLQPPDPSEPEGCPGNPQQLGSYAFAFFYDPPEVTEDEPGQVHGWGTDLLQLYRTSATDTRRGAEWIGEAGPIDLAQRICQTATSKEELPNGLQVCRKNFDGKTSRPEDWRAAYIAKRDTYATPLGRTFVINCTDGIFSSPVGDCQVAYSFTPDLGIAYRVRPYHGTRRVPIDRIIEFDRGLRAQIEAALVANYPWPDRRDVQSTQERP